MLNPSLAAHAALVMSPPCCARKNIFNKNSLAPTVKVSVVWHVNSHPSPAAAGGHDLLLQIFEVMRRLISAGSRPIEANQSINSSHSTSAWVFPGIMLSVNPGGKLLDMFNLRSSASSRGPARKTR